MSSGIIFAWIAAILFSLWTVFHQLASDSINKLFGAIIVSLTAAIIGALFLLPQIKSVELYSNPKGLIFAILAGACAIGIDFFALKAYGNGLPISIGGPIILGGSVALATLIGFMLGDSLSTAKIVGITLILAGAVILSRLQS